ncbi:hypothetical protein DSECCO2_581500 [anaerobic digester metagenome]
MVTTMGVKYLARASGAASPWPVRMRSWMRRNSLEMAALPIVSTRMSMVVSTGTPLACKMEKIEAKRDMAALRNNMPMMGMCRKKASRATLPPSVLNQKYSAVATAAKPPSSRYQYSLMATLSAIATRVGQGSATWALAKISAKTGITKVSSTKKAMARATTTVMGYCRADLMSERTWCSWEMM